MQGIFVNDERPASKAAVKRALAADPNSVSLQATSLFGNDLDGPVADLPTGRYTFVGPCPCHSRKFFGTLTVDNARGIAKVS